MTPREPCGHVWGPWETVYEGTLGGDDARATEDRVRQCVLCRKREARWITWSSLFGMDPDYTGGQDVSEYLDESRGEA